MARNMGHPGGDYPTRWGRTSDRYSFRNWILSWWTEAGVVIIIAILIRAAVVHNHPERGSIFAILGAGALVGSALRDFATSMLGLFKK